MILAVAFTLQALSLQPQWQVQSSIDPITDRRDSLAVLTSLGNHLAIGCSGSTGGVAVITFEASRHLAYDGRAGMSYRFDGGQPERALVGYSDRQVHILRATSSTAFVDRLLQSRTLVIQVFDDDGVPHNAVFELPADHAAVTSALSTCRPFENIE